MGIDLACEHIDSVILDAADKLESLFRSWGLPTRLREIGAKEEDFKELAEKTLMVRKPGAIQSLDYDDIYKILQMAYE